MHKAKVCGVQGQTRRATVVGDRRFIEWAAVLDVAADRMTQLRQMNANLIRATGLQLTLKFGVVTDRAERIYVSHGPLAVDSVRTAAAHSVAPVTDKRRRDCLCFKLTGNNAEITSKLSVRCELFDEMRLSGFGSGEGQRAAGLAVDTVNGQQFDGAAVASIFTACD